MATKRRSHSESGFYHVFHRGVSRFDIFEDDEDRRFYLERLKEYAKELDVDIHAFCLMSNHTHLLLRSDFENLSALMRKLGSVYAKRFNRRHSRTGPLFEGRFGSVCVENDAQFMCVVRYIHRNPIHHEEAALLGEYPWSSYGEYLSASPAICVIDFALEMFGGISAFSEFHKSWDPRERHLDLETIGRMKDEEARSRANIALSEAGFGISVSQIGTLSRQVRDRAISCVIRSVGCSLRQIQRLTAMAYFTIRRAVGAKKGEGDVRDDEMHHELTMAELVAAFEKSKTPGKPPVPLRKTPFATPRLSSS